jgi:hypothetical protein
MNSPLTDYYSVSSRGYTKHPNIEILGIDPVPLPQPKTANSVLSVEKDFSGKSVIK